MREVWPAVPDVGDHIDNRAPALLHPLGVDLAHDNEAAGQVVAHHSLETLGGNGLQGRPVLPAGVVEQPVDAPVFVKYLVDDTADRRLVADVCGVY